MVNSRMLIPRGYISKLNININKSSKSAIQAKKREMLKSARRIIPEMQICEELNCRYCTITDYPDTAPCSVCERKGKTKVLSTLYSCPETKLIHEYYAPICGDECMYAYFEEDAREFNRKMGQVMKEKGFDVKWGRESVQVRPKEHPMFVNQKESYPRFQILKEDWEVKNREEPTVTSIKMLINDSPSLSEPCDFILHSSVGSTKLFFQELSKRQVPENWKIEYPGVALPDEFVISAVLTLSDKTQEPVVIRLKQSETVTVWYYYDKMNRSYFQKVSKSEELGYIIAMLLPAVALGVHFALPELIFFGLLLKNYLLKVKVHKNFKLSALCLKYCCSLLIDNSENATLDEIENTLEIFLQMGTLLGCCNEFELSCMEYSSALEWADKHNGSAGSQYGCVLNSLGLSYKTTGQYQKARDCYNKSLKILKSRGEYSSLPLVERNIDLLNAAEITSKFKTRDAQEILINDRLSQVEGHLRDAGFLQKEMNLKACHCCNKRGKELLVCGGCKRVRYCDRNCQKKHWSEHKQYCKKS